MLRIGAMNLALHGIESPNIHGMDALSEDSADGRDNCSLILANPPFKGPLNYDETAKDLLQVADRTAVSCTVPQTTKIWRTVRRQRCVLLRHAGRRLQS